MVWSRVLHRVFLLSVILQKHRGQSWREGGLLQDSYDNSNTQGTQSKCMSRVPIPHFLTEHYTVPASDLTGPEECGDLTSPEIRTAVEEEEAEFRLPTNIEPVHYALQICPNLHTFGFTGLVVIDLTVKQTTGNVTLNAVDLIISEVKIWEDENATADQSRPQIKPKQRINNKKGRKIDNVHSTSYKTDEDVINFLAQNSSVLHFLKNQNSNYMDILKFLLGLTSTQTETKNEEKEDYYTDTTDNDPTNSYIRITDKVFDYGTQKLTFIVNRELESGRKYKLSIKFSGDLLDQPTGFYKTFYKDDNGTVRWSAVTQFQVGYARSAFPCFDEPALKARFSITLCRERHMTALSNMPRLETSQRENSSELLWDVFSTSVPMSTYLVAFAVTDYEHISCTNAHIPFKVWVPGPVIHQTNFSCEVSPRLLTFFEDYFNIAYPLPKVDLVGIPQFFAFGMENWGLITFIIDRLAIDNLENNLVARRNVLETISHEIAHQWFGNLVTPHWWSDIWLNEGFATFLSILGADHILPEWQKMKEDIVERQHTVMMKDSFESSHPVVFSVSNPKDYFSIFDEISYRKGCFLVRMIMHVLTEKTFQRGLRYFLREFRYSTASQNDLWRALSAIGHSDGTLPRGLEVSDFMHNWIYQEGYPIVSIKRLHNGSAVFWQKRYYLENDEEIYYLHRLETGMEEEKWWIPLSFTTTETADMSATQPRYWLTTNKSQITVDSMPPLTDWYLVNMQQTGFFRVNYDIDNWKLLTEQLKEDPFVFDSITRSQLVDDSFVLAYSDELSYDIPFTMLEYLGKEDSSLVVKAAVLNISPLLDAVSHDGIFGYFKDYVLSTFGSHFPSRCFFPEVDVFPFVYETQVLIVQEFGHFHKKCQNEAKQVFDEWKTHRANYSFVDSELLQTLLCIAVAEGGEDEWNVLWNELKSKRYPAMEDVLVHALVCTRHRWMLGKLIMDLALDEDETLNFDNVVILLSVVAENPIGIDIAWDFTKTLWPQVSDSYHGVMFLEAVSPHIRSKQHYDELVELFQSVLQTNGNDYDARYLTEVVHNVDRRISFYSRHYTKLVKWFKKSEKAQKNTYTWKHTSKEL